MGLCDQACSLIHLAFSVTLMLDMAHKHLCQSMSYLPCLKTPLTSTVGTPFSGLHFSRR